MSIFGTRRETTTTVAVESYKGYVQDDLAGLQMILAESARESFQLRAGMYISDVMMEETVLEGAATPEVLLEGFVKGSFDKIKRMFEALWAKVKSWFEAAKKTLQRIFLSGEAFIKKFKEEIRSASKKGFTYEGFKYTLDAGHGKVTAKLKTLNDEIAAAVGFDISHVIQDSQSSSISGDSGKHKESFDLSEEKEKLLKALGNEELS
jgi:hypothetical protein